MRARVTARCQSASIRSAGEVFIKSDYRSVPVWAEDEILDNPNLEIEPEPELSDLDDTEAVEVEPEPKPIKQTRMVVNKKNRGKRL